MTDPRKRLPFLTNLIATAFFAGYSPVASGTVGSLVAVLLYLIPGMEQWPVLLLATTIAFVLGVPAAAKTASIVGDELTESARRAKEKFQSNTAHGADPSIVVIDEVVGMWISLLFLPKDIFAIIIAFVAFRAFDIIKPFPVRQLERYPNGWGIMLDDVMAGIYANVAARLSFELLSFVLPFVMS